MNSSRTPRPNDPRRVDDGPARAAIKRGFGVTKSESYLAKLAERNFLNLWSYPNTFIDKKVRNKGDGKELCDLLVVCGDHVLIFSDKTVGWPTVKDVRTRVAPLVQARHSKVSRSNQRGRAVDVAIPRANLPRQAMHAATSSFTSAARPQKGTRNNSGKWSRCGVPVLLRWQQL